MDTDARDFAALIEATKELNEETLLKVEHPTLNYEAPLLVLPEGRKVESIKRLLDEYASFPDRIEGTSLHTTLASFIAHVVRAKRPESVIFADDKPSGPALHAVFDYDEAEPGEGDDEASAGFRRHRAIYLFPLSDEWQAWTAVGGKTMSQSDFAEFIEDRMIDVLLPEEGQDSIKEFAARLELTLATPRQLLELSRGLKINVDMRVENAINLSSGEARLTFVTENRDAQGQQLKVPGGFAISIPVFRGGPRYDVPVILRHRVASGKVTWTCALYRTDIIFRRVFTKAAESAAADTGLPLFFGTAEGSR